MTLGTVLLGDPHNFGRRVSRTGDVITKPRSIAWERLLLSSRSPLRQHLERAVRADGLGAEAFAFLPSLAFSRDRAEAGGSVSAIDLAPLGRVSAEARRSLAVTAGRLLALTSWFGLADLHWENLALGRSPDGRIVFGPLDVELVLDDLELPTDTKLIPDGAPDVAAECRHAAGFRRLLPYLGKPIATATLLDLVAAYRKTLAFLERQRDSIATILAEQPNVLAAPIRVCLRGTAEYAREDLEALDPPLLDAEREQLLRGDIPYFFRRLGKPGIRYFTSPDLSTERCLPARGDVPRLAPLLSLARALRSPRRRTLRDEGALAIVGAFDHADLAGVHETPDLRLHVGPREIAIEFADGGELVGPRNLRDYVESLYLPCQCGEVRTVLAAASRCDAHAKSARLRPSARPTKSR